MTDFTGLVAIITGAASGIGAATAVELMSRGAAVVILDRDVSGASPDALSIGCDITDPDAVAAAVARVAEELGGIDIVINNAGIGASGTVADNDDDEWGRVLDVNVTGMARIVRAALPHLERSEHAAVVNMSSAVAYVGVRNRALYSASKAAVVGLTLGMAADHVRSGIRVNAVAPGTAETPWIDRLLQDSEDPDAAAEALRQRQPIGRLVAPVEVARALAYLASPLSGSTTGTILRVDGGMSSLRV
jgi:NAD(P)-dependent dehydrogenase (short-subunit alcohol dehydrogenase family)